MSWTTCTMPETRAMRSKHRSTMLEGKRDGDECGWVGGMKPNANVATFLIFGSIVFMDTVWDIKMNWPHFFWFDSFNRSRPFFILLFANIYAHTRTHTVYAHHPSYSASSDWVKCQMKRPWCVSVWIHNWAIQLKHSHKSFHLVCVCVCACFFYIFYFILFNGRPQLEMVSRKSKQSIGHLSKKWKLIPS